MISWCLSLLLFGSLYLGPLVTSVSSASSRPPDTHSNRGPRNEFEHSLKPNKEIILLFGVSGCSAPRLSSCLQSIISDAARQTRLSKIHREEGERNEENIKPRVIAGVGTQTSKGSARTRTVYVLQQEVPPHHPYPLREEKEGIVANPSPFRTHEGVIPDFSSNQKSGASTPPPINRRGPPENPSSHGEEGWEGPPPCSQEEADSPCSLDKEEKGGPTPPDQEVGHPSRPPSQGGPPTQTSQGLSEGPPASPLCEIDSVTLHHMDCAMIHLKKCASFINPDILVELALSSECVKVVDFDYKAFPINSDPEEEESEKEGETGQTSSSSDSLAHARRRGPPSSETEGRRGRTKHLALPPFLPNDPLLLSGAQWELLDAAGVQARKAWMASKGGEGSVKEQPTNTIAVIDFGFNIGHEDMFDSWWRNALVEAPDFSEWPHNCHDGIDNDANGYVDDCFGYSFANRSGEITAFAGSHGTAVASSCCATTNNGKGIASLGWNLRPMALKIDGSYSQIAEALNYAADKRVSVVNMSFGGPPSAALRASLAVAAARDMSLIVAAGNHQCDLATVEAGGCLSENGSLKGFPAGYGDLFPNVVAVAAVAPDGKPAKFTNFDSSANPKIHVLAPGDSILTCSNVGVRGYVRASGTSFATPIVAAVAAMIRYERPDLTAREVKRLLVGSCRTASGANLHRVAKCGGILSAARALRNAGIHPPRLRRE